MPRHGLDLIDHVIVDGRSIHGRIDEKLEVGAATAPNIGRPSESSGYMEKAWSTAGRAAFP
jgi:hypothetical protein